MIGLSLGLWQNRPSFSPLSLSPLAWWDWSDTTKLYTDSGLATLVSADGDPLGGIKDKSGNNYHLTQTDGTAKGLYKTAIQNGKSIGRTDGVNDFWTVTNSKTAFKSMHYTGGTLVFAGKVGLTANPNAGYGVCANNGNNGTNGFAFFLENRTGTMTKACRPIIYSINGASVADAFTASANYANTFPPATSSVVSFKTDPQNSTLANRISVFLNNGSGINGNTSNGSASSSDAQNNLMVGSNVNNLGVNNFFAPADFYELLFFSSILSDANLALVMNYLNTKWGIY